MFDESLNVEAIAEAKRKRKRLGRGCVCVCVGRDDDVRVSFCSGLMSVGRYPPCKEATLKEGR